jgi:hypothetical protein
VTAQTPVIPRYSSISCTITLTWASEDGSQATAAINATSARNQLRKTGLALSCLLARNITSNSAVIN